MALEDTLRLKVELDQTDLGSDLSNIRNSIASAATPALSNISTDVVRDQYGGLYGVGIANRHMMGDISNAGGFVSGVAQQALSAGQGLAQSLVPAYTPPPLQYPLQNVPIEVGFGAAMGNRMSSAFGMSSRLNPSLSVDQSRAISGDYFSNVMSGTSGQILGAETAVGGLSAGAGMLAFAAMPLLPAIAVGALASAAIGAVAAPGITRLQDIQSLEAMGYSPEEARAAFSGEGFWGAIGRNLNPLDTSDNFLAGAFVDGMEINGRNYTRQALAAQLLNTGAVDMSAANLQAGYLGMNALVKQTGMTLPDAAAIARSFSTPGALSDSGYQTFGAMMGLMAPTGDYGRNSRFQNAMLPAVSSRMAAAQYHRGGLAGVKRAADDISFLDGITADSLYNPDMAGVMSPDRILETLSTTGAMAGQSPMGSAAITLAALGDAGMSPSEALAASFDVTSGGIAAISDMQYKRTIIADQPREVIKASIAMAEAQGLIDDSMDNGEKLSILAMVLGSNTEGGRFTILEELTKDAKKATAYATYDTHKTRENPNGGIPTFAGNGWGEYKGLNSEFDLRLEELGYVNLAAFYHNVELSKSHQGLETTFGSKAGFRSDLMSAITDAKKALSSGQLYPEQRVLLQGTLSNYKKTLNTVMDEIPAEELKEFWLGSMIPDKGEEDFKTLLNDLASTSAKLAAVANANSGGGLVGTK